MNVHERFVCVVASMCVCMCVGISHIYTRRRLCEGVEVRGGGVPSGGFAFVTLHSARSTQTKSGVNTTPKQGRNTEDQQRGTTTTKNGGEL